MYRIAVSREFDGRHVHLDGSGAEESGEHAHHYRLELVLSGEDLDDRGYLVDVLEIGGVLDRLTARYREGPLNGLPEFDGMNPSVENFARIARAAFIDSIELPPGSNIEARVWESGFAWASFDG